MKSISSVSVESAKTSATHAPSANTRPPCSECGGSMDGKRLDAKTCSVPCSQARAKRRKKERRLERQEKSHQKYLESFQKYLKTDKAFIWACANITVLKYKGFRLSFELIWQEVIYRCHDVGYKENKPLQTFLNGWRKIAREMMEEEYPDTKKMINHHSYKPSK